MAITISLTNTGLHRSALHRSAARAAGAIVIALALPHRASGADWTLQPTLTLRESYSDNIRLAPPQEAQSAWVSEISPGIAVTGNTRALKLNLAYQIQKIVAQSEPDRLSQQLSASATAVLLADRIFIDINSSISQQNNSAFGPQLVDNIYITGNQSTIKTNSISPYMRYRMNGFASTALRYTHGTVSSDTLSIQTDALMLDLVGDKGGRRWNWSANYSQRTSHDSLLAPVTTSNGSLSLNLPLTATLGLFATTGYEKSDYQARTSVAPVGRSWSAGASWNPSSRTSVTASAGRRYFGNTYAVNASHRRHNSVWNIVYSEDITTNYAQFLVQSRSDTSALLNQLWQVSIPDSVLRQQAIDVYIGLGQLIGSGVGNLNYFSHRYFLQKQLNMSAALSGARSTLVMTLSSSRSTAQTVINIDSLLLGANESQLEDQSRRVGANMSWNWRMSSKNSVNLSASSDKINSLNAGRIDNNLIANIGISRQFQPGLQGAVDLRQIRHTSNEGPGYREASLHASLNFRF
jgi:uncharacterized protein (PEP-CTERM system associated)